MIPDTSKSGPSDMFANAEHWSAEHNKTIEAAKAIALNEIALALWHIAADVQVVRGVAEEFYKALEEGSFHG